MGGAGAADPANTRSLNYGANENKAIGANVFNSNNTNETPAFIRITAIRGKNSGGAHGLMTLENGEEIVVGQVISRDDFERIFWNASKSDGSFSFVPVQDAKGTAAPNTVEQTVVIKTPETPAPSSNPGTSSGEGGNTGHEAGSQTGAASGSGAGSSTGSGTGSSTGTGANTGANAGTGTANNGTDSNNTTGQQSGNNQGDGSAQNTGSPSGTGESSNQGASSGDGTTPAGGKPGAEGSGSENKPSTGSGADSTSGSASGSGSTGGSGSSTGSDGGKDSGSDKGGAATGEGQGGQSSEGQAPSQNVGGPGSESQTAPQTPSGQGSGEQTTSPTQGSPSGEQTPAQNASGQGDASQTPPQNAGGGSDTGNPGTGGTAQTGETQTGGVQTGGAQTGGAQTGTSETGSDDDHSNGDHGDGKQTSDGEQTSDGGQNGAADGDGKQNGDGDAKHEGDGAEGEDTKGEDTKGEDGEQGKNGEDTASQTNPPVTTPPPTPPDYAPNQSVQQAIHANNKPVGASIFNGTNPAHAPSFVKITAVLDKDGREVSDAMTLGKGGEAITTDQVISKEQFESVFLDALKAPGGSFKFIPVMDSKGTEMPGATEQTVSIGFNYVHHFQSEPFREAYEGEDRFSYYRIHSLTEHQDTNGTLDGMFKLDGGERTTLKLGDLIRPEDFDKVYWDYSSNNGGRFTLVGVDASGKDLTDEKNQNLVLEDVAKTRTGKLPPEEPGGEETDDEDGDDIAGHSAALHPESFTDAASAFHGSSHFSVNGQSTLDNLLDQQMNHSII